MFLFEKKYVKHICLFPKGKVKYFIKNKTQLIYIYSCLLLLR